ncbi:MBL fold metallo-hydrolase [Staphylococcus roterodami]|nr:MBL fold metallo-hydrolase [Staphylococcus roterodami]UMT80615.1 MBL fold metallo-hydrolase [Staphylococcus roterodami]
MTNQYKNNQFQPYTNLNCITQNLYATPTSELPFDKRFLFKSFILKREAGNVMIYHSGRLDEVEQDVASLGGVSKVLMNHDHESLGGSNQFDAPYYIHQNDADGLKNKFSAQYQLSNREMLDKDLEIIPAPGHTPGTTLFLWDDGHHRYLFTGDFICFEGNIWRTVILGSSDREKSIQSLEMIKELDFDVLVPWVSVKDEPLVYFVEDENEKQKQIQNIIDRVRKGENR